MPNTPYNPVTGLEYRGNNADTLKRIKPDNLQWAGFSQWLTVGRCVRKGEHGQTITVVFEAADDKSNNRTAVTSRTVFNLSQTEILKPEEQEKLKAPPLESYNTWSAATMSLVPVKGRKVEHKGYTLGLHRQGTNWIATELESGEALAHGATYKQCKDTALTLIDTKPELSALIQSALAEHGKAN